MTTADEPIFAGGQSTDSPVSTASTSNDNIMTLEAVETTSVAVATSEAVMSTDGRSAAMSTSDQLLTSDVMQSTTTDADLESGISFYHNGSQPADEKSSPKEAWLESLDPF